MIYALPAGLLGVIIDFILQKAFKKYYWIFILESLFLGFLFLHFSYSQRTKTLIIPPRLPGKYVVTIYGVENAPKLPLGLLSWSYEIKVPENGILLTSTDISSDLPETKMKTYTGLELNTDTVKFGWVSFDNGKFDCNGKTYQYQSWMVDSPNCCIYSSDELKKFKINLQHQFCSR